MRKLILFTYLFFFCNMLQAILLIQGAKQDGSVINDNTILTFDDECSFHCLNQADIYKWEFKIYYYNKVTEDTIIRTYYEGNERDFHFKIYEFPTLPDHSWVFGEKESEFYSPPIKAEVCLTMEQKDGMQISQPMIVFLNLRPMSTMEISVVNRAPLGIDGSYDWYSLKFANDEQRAAEIMVRFSNEDGITEYDIEENPWYLNYPVDSTNESNWNILYRLKNNYGWIYSKEYDLYELLSQYDPTSIRNKDTTIGSFLVSSYINNYLHLKSESFHNNDIIRIYSTTGKEIMSTLFNGQSHIDLSTYPEGIYLLQIQRDNHCIYRDKIILKH